MNSSKSSEFNTALEKLLVGANAMKQVHCQPIRQPEIRLTLNLTLGEATALFSVTSIIVGSSEHSHRGLFDEIRRNLTNMNIREDRSMIENFGETTIHFVNHND